MTDFSYDLWPRVSAYSDSPSKHGSKSELDQKRLRTEHNMPTMQGMHDDWTTNTYDGANVSDVWRTNTFVGTNLTDVWRTNTYDGAKVTNPEKLGNGVFGGVVRIDVTKSSFNNTTTTVQKAVKIYNTLHTPDEMLLFGFYDMTGNQVWRDESRMEPRLKAANDREAEKVMRFGNMVAECGVVPCTPMFCTNLCKLCKAIIETEHFDETIVKQARRNLKSGAHWHLEMEVMQGDLDKLFKETPSAWDRLNYVVDILKYLACAAEKGLAYVDMKAENCLYKRGDDNKVQVYLGDIGSFCHIAGAAPNWPEIGDLVQESNLTSSVGRIIDDGGYINKFMVDFSDNKNLRNIAIQSMKPVQEQRKNDAAVWTNPYAPEKFSEITSYRNYLLPQGTGYSPCTYETCWFSGIIMILQALGDMGKNILQYSQTQDFKLHNVQEIWPKQHKQTGVERRAMHLAKQWWPTDKIARAGLPRVALAMLHSKLKKMLASTQETKTAYAIPSRIIKIAKKIEDLTLSVGTFFDKFDSKSEDYNLERATKDILKSKRKFIQREIQVVRHVAFHFKDTYFQDADPVWFIVHAFAKRMRTRTMQKNTSKRHEQKSSKEHDELVNFAVAIDEAEKKLVQYRLRPLMMYRTMFQLALQWLNMELSVAIAFAAANEAVAAAPQPRPAKRWQKNKPANPKPEPNNREPTGPTAQMLAPMESIAPTRPTIPTGPRAPMESIESKESIESMESIKSIAPTRPKRPTGLPKFNFHVGNSSASDKFALFRSSSSASKGTELNFLPSSAL